jgi:hypothetical protein
MLSHLENQVKRFVISQIPKNDLVSHLFLGAGLFEALKI